MIIGIVANGQEDLIPELSLYKEEIDCWIGADRGALHIINAMLPLRYAIGDFDSVSSNEKSRIENTTYHFNIHPAAKNKTDLELAIEISFELKVEKLYLFGVTGGRLDHTLANIQLLYLISLRNVEASIIDRNNQLNITKPGVYKVIRDIQYPNHSFIPQTKKVSGLSLEGFAYPLYNKDVYWGQTRCISNYLLEEHGTYSYNEGVLLHIKSCDI